MDYPTTTTRRRGRPSLPQRREKLIMDLGTAKVTSMDGEAGRPCEQLSKEDFSALYKCVAREKGWPECY